MVTLCILSCYFSNLILSSRQNESIKSYEEEANEPDFFYIEDDNDKDYQKSFSTVATWNSGTSGLRVWTHYPRMCWMQIYNALTSSHKQKQQHYNINDRIFTNNINSQHLCFWNLYLFKTSRFYLLGSQTGERGPLGAPRWIGGDISWKI